MNIKLVQADIVSKYDNVYTHDDGNKYPTTDLVRLESWFFDNKPGRLLEYGFGGGNNLLFFLSKGYIIDGIEASQEAINRFNEKYENKKNNTTTIPNLTLIKPNDRKLPFDNETFDYIICTSVLSLLGSKESVESLIEEFVRILKIGGKTIVDINAPDTDFAKGQNIGNDQYIQNNNTNEKFIHYCPAESTFKSILSERLNLVDLGYNARDYFGRKTIEFIACCTK